MPRAGGKAAEAVYRYLDSLGDAGPPVAAPLSSEQASALAGACIFGPKANDRIEITVNRGH
jgi:hypothetical protein